MREDEADRRLFRIPFQQELLVLHDQLIGADIIGSRFLSTELAVDHFPLTVYGEITGMSFGRRDAVQVLDIVIFSNSNLKIANDIFIFFFKHRGIFPVYRLAGGVIFPVICHFINEEQTQDLDPLIEQLPLSLDMGKDRLADLNAAQLVLIYLAEHIPGIDFDSVQKFHGVVAAVNGLYDVSVPVFFQTVGIVIKIVADLDNSAFYLCAGCLLYIELQGCGGITLGKVNALQIQVAVGCRGTGFGDSLYSDLLDQAFVVGLHGVQAINHVIDAVGSVRGGIAERQKGMELLQAFFGLFAFHRLRFVDDQDRVRFRNNIDRPAGTEFVQFHVNTSGILSLGIERLGVDDHDVDGAVGGKAVDLCQL